MSVEKDAPKDIFEAVMRGDLGQLDNFLCKDTDVNLTDSNGQTAIHLICMTGNHEMLHNFVDYYPDWEVQNREGKTALEVAVEWGHAEIMNFLLDHGAIITDDLLNNKAFQSMQEGDFIGVSDIDEDFFGVSDLGSEFEETIDGHVECSEIIDDEFKDDREVVWDEDGLRLMDSVLAALPEEFVEMVKGGKVEEFDLEKDYIERLKGILEDEYIREDIDGKLEEDGDGMLVFGEKFFSFVMHETTTISGDQDERENKEFSVRLRNFFWDNLPEDVIPVRPKKMADVVRIKETTDVMEEERILVKGRVDEPDDEKIVIHGSGHDDKHGQVTHVDGGKDSKSVVDSMLKGRKGFQAIPPLMQAVVKNDMDDVKKLIEDGANIEQRDTCGNTCIMMAMAIHANEIARVLLAKKARTNIKNSKGRTALSCAVYANNPEGVELMAHSRENLNLRFKEGTFLVIAARKQFDGVVKVLLDYGADVNLKDIHGKTAVYYAEQTGNKKIIDLLEKISESKDRVVKKKKKRTYY